MESSLNYLFLLVLLLQAPKGKKAKKSGSNIFTLFSQKQIQEFKEAFGIIDADKDGIITANDLKAAFASVGRNKLSCVLCSGRRSSPQLRNTARTSMLPPPQQVGTNADLPVLCSLLWKKTFAIVKKYCKDLKAAFASVGGNKRRLTCPMSFALEEDLRHR